MLWRKADGAVGFWSLEGTEFGSEATIAQPVGTQYRMEAIGDLSGDGTEDILWRDTTTNDVAIWLMESKTFKTAEFLSFKVDQSWQVNGIADFDGDGKGDVLWRHKASQSFAIWYMDGIAMRSAKIFGGIDNAWDIKGTGDFNGDGKTEILWRNTTDNRVSMGSVTPTGHTFSDMKYNGACECAGGSRLRGGAIADFGGDGKSDILWRNTAGNIAVWEMNGSLIANPNMVKDPKTGADIVISRDVWGIVGAGTYYVQVTPAGATDYNSYRLSLGVVPLTATLGFSAATDSGVSGDGITKDSRPMVEGTGPVGSVLRLYGQAVGGAAGTVQPQVLLGSVTVGSGGDWKIQSPELADGDYKLSAKIVLATGKEQKIGQDWSVKIDTVDPNLQMLDLIDGIAWGNGESLRGDLVDRDDLSRVQYWFANAPLSKTDLAVVGGKVSGSLTLPAGIAAFTNQTVVFRSWDRAGNEQTNSYDFMVFEEGNGLDSSDTFGQAVADELTHDLTHLARFVRDNSLYSVMGDSFHGLYRDLHGRLTNNTISRKQATVMGLELAQKLAKDKLQVSWKAFQAEVWATTYKGLNLSVASIADRTNVQTAMNGLSETYYRISQSGGRGYFGELLSHSLVNNETEIGEKFVMDEFGQLFKTQEAPTSAIAAIKLSDRLLQASRRVVDLNVKWPTGGPENFLNWSGMTSGALLELGFEIARSNPTITSGENPMSEWIETLIELPDGVAAADKALREKGLRSAAGGLSEWFEGFDLGPLLTDSSSAGYNGRNQMPGTLQKAIDYAGRLVMAARAIDDGSLVGEMKRSDFLSHLVNLGGAYAGIQNGKFENGLGIIKPNTSLFDDKMNFFADIIWEEKDLTRGTQEFRDYFQLFDAGKNTHLNRVAAFKLQTDILRLAEEQPYTWQELVDPFLLAPMFVQNGSVEVVKSPIQRPTTIAQNPFASLKRYLSDPTVYSGIPPWEKRASDEEIKIYQNENATLGGKIAGWTLSIDSRDRIVGEMQRRWAESIIQSNSEFIRKAGVDYLITPEAIAGVIWWESAENPYKWIRTIASGNPPLTIPVNSPYGILGKMKISGKDAITEKVENEGRVPFRNRGWKERAKLLGDPKIAIQYIAAILDRTADLYEEEVMKARQNIDRVQGLADRKTFNIRDQAGVLGALFQGGDEEARAVNFEARRTEETMFLNRISGLLDQSLDSNASGSSLVCVVQQFRTFAKIENKPTLKKAHSLNPYTSGGRYASR
ncbi:MAG: VCBS repeat-containing protein, partial [Alkalinema sp. RU_4_3]|nr:VCBS repeat-containing protein [Alkalinema sp. RU_4_3]